jgi:hypothetical protein
MAVGVDETRREHETAGIDHLFAGACRQPAHLGNGGSVDPDVDPAPGRSRPVHDEGVPDQGRGRLLHRGGSRCQQGDEERRPTHRR